MISVVPLAEPGLAWVRPRGVRKTAVVALTCAPAMKGTACPQGFGTEFDPKKQVPMVYPVKYTLFWEESRTKSLP